MAPTPLISALKPPKQKRSIKEKVKESLRSLKKKLGIKANTDKQPVVRFNEVIEVVVYERWMSKGVHINIF